MKLVALLAKDARLLVRHRALLAALVLYPFLLAGVLGAAFSEPPARLDLVVVDGDAGGAALEVGGEQLTSASLVEALRAFADVRLAADEAEALALLRTGEVDAALLVPPGFVRDLARLGSQAELRVVVDEADPIRAQVARHAVAGAVDAFLEQVVQKKIDDVLRLIELTVEGGPTRVVLVEVQVLGLRNARARLVEVHETLDRDSAEARKLREVIGFLDFAAGTLGDSERYLTTTALPLRTTTTGLSGADARLAAVALPGAILLGVFWTGALAAAVLVAREAESGTRRRLLAAPLPRGLPDLSKLLVALAAALVPALALVALGRAFLGAVVADAAATAVVLVAASFAAAALGALAAAVARGTAGAALVAVLALVPMLLLGGLFYPVAYMPEGAQAVARALPLTLATDALRGAMVRASPWRELAVPLGGLALATFALLAAAAGLRRRA